MLGLRRRWSHQLQWASKIKFPHVAIALEGCGAGFNATNSIRTCLYFRTQPPFFIGKSNFRDILSLKVEDENIANQVIRCRQSIDSILLSDSNNEMKIIAVENFVPGCVAMDGTTTTTTTNNLRRMMFHFPENSLIVMGHENKGVSQTTLEKADHVVYVPQFGTISSVNVVSCMGLTMFHYLLSRQRDFFFQKKENCRNDCHNDYFIAENIVVEMRREITKRIEQQQQQSKEKQEVEVEKKEQANSSCSTKTINYHQQFQEALPKDADGNRIDKRPIHPSFFHLEHSEIQSQMEQQRKLIKTFSSASHQDDDKTIFENENEKDSSSSSKYLINLFEEISQKRISNQLESMELSVFFENFADQRNLGGLVRNANAFLASVYYAGRKKINKQGTVGSDHYTPIEFLGPMKDPQLLHRHAVSSSTSNLNSDSENEKNEKNDEELFVTEYASETIEKIEETFSTKNSTATTEWWFLDCQQEMLFSKYDQKRYEIFCKRISIMEEKIENLRTKNNSNESFSINTNNNIGNKGGGGGGIIRLERIDQVLTSVLDLRLNKNKNRLILVIPPETGLPCDYILNKCSKRVMLSFDELASSSSENIENDNEGADEKKRRGLPSQIASAIALHQLSPLCLF